MVRKIASSFLTLALVWCPRTLPAQVGDPEVARGIKQVDEGEYDEAILTLDAVARRLSGQPGRQADLAQAYLYLGVAYLGKGHETSAKARFRDALGQLKDLRLSPDKFAPKVIEIFEKAKEESGKAAAAASPPAPGSPGPAPKAEKKGGSKTPLILIGVGAAAAAGVAVAVSGGGGGDKKTTGTGGLRTQSFPNEVVVFGGGREFVVDASGPGKLTAKVTWQQQGVPLGMYIVNLAATQNVLANGGQTATNELTLQLDVTKASYRISVTNSTGAGPQVNTTFTLTVTLP